MSIAQQTIGTAFLEANLLSSFFGSYFHQLYPASWNGVPFVVEGNDTSTGRRNAEHIYPFRDTPWMEDIGRRARKYEVVGFLVGDDVIAQRDAMQSAVEYPGPGVLVHPTYGTLIVSCTDCQFRENKSHGRVIEINFRFGESGLVTYPTTTIATSSILTNFCSFVNQAISDSFVSDIADALTSVGSTVSDISSSVLGQIGTTVSPFLSSIGLAGADAASIFNVATTLIGPFGRYYGASNASSSGSINGSYVAPSQVSIQVASLTSQNIQNIQSISVASDLALEDASASPSTFPAAVQSLINTLITSIANPADAIRIFTSLNSFAPPPITSTSTIGLAQTNVQNATADLCRRAAAVALAYTVSNYQPTSQNDAENIQNAVDQILTSEIIIAGDQGDDVTFTTISNLRTSVIENLIQKGSQLAPLKTFTTNAPVPSLALAYQYYQDINRTDELVGFADPRHPAFMPTSYQALSY